MKITVFETVRDSQGKVIDLPWERFVEYISRHEEAVEKDSVKCWSPAIFMRNVRNKGECDRVEMLVGDVDDGTPPDLLGEIMQERGVEAVLVSSFSHQDDFPKYRVIVPLDAPIRYNAEDWPVIWDRFNLLCGGRLDKKCKDPSRLYFRTSCPPGAPRFARHLPGVALTAEKLPPLPAAPFVPEPKSYNPPPSGDPYANRALEKEITNVVTATKGGRNDTLNRAAFALGQLIAAGRLYEADVVSALTTAALGIGLVAHEIKATIESGLREGKKTPRYEGVIVEPPSAVPKGTGSKVEVYTARQLLACDWPEPEFLIPGVVQAGLTILGGASKLGKSLLATDLGLQLALGGVPLGVRKVEPCRVLYLALEDTARRCAGRIWKNLEGGEAPDLLHIAVKWPRANEGGLDYLGKWFNKYPDTKLVIIDTLVRFRATGNRFGNAYQDDYNSVTPIHEMCKHFDSSCIIVSHVRKGGDDDGDVFELLNGSNGLFAATDAAIILRRKRGEDIATLHTLGRDMPYTEYAIELDPTTLRWSIKGEADDYEETRLLSSILEAVQEFRTIAMKDLINAIRSVMPNVSQGQVIATVGKLIARGDIRKVNSTLILNEEPSPIEAKLAPLVTPAPLSTDDEEEDPVHEPQFLGEPPEVDLLTKAFSAPLPRKPPPQYGPKTTYWRNTLSVFSDSYSQLWNHYSDKVEKGMPLSEAYKGLDMACTRWQWLHADIKKDYADLVLEIKEALRVCVT